MNVSLPSTLENFVRERVQAGRYGSASEVVREGLRLLMDQEESKAERLAVLRERIQTGLDQIDKGETVGMDEVFEGIDGIIAKAKNEKS